MDRPSGIPRVLSIAGSDSGGGAGIQADLKAFAACGVHGMTAITAITAQNTVGVIAVHKVPAEMILAQVHAVSSDIGIDAVKIGMLADAVTIEAVAQALDQLPRDAAVVLDPVMVAESGAVLLEPAAREALIELMLPRATVITPNLPEARALVSAAERDAALDRENRENRENREDGEGSGNRENRENREDGEGSGDRENRENRDGRGRGDGEDGDDVEDGEIHWLAQILHGLGPTAVVITGGHRHRATDVYLDATHHVEIPGPRHPGGAAHGSGCTHASVLAARLAWGDEPLQAARWARRMAAQAVANGLRDVGIGAGPVDVLGVTDRRQALPGAETF